MMSNIVYRLKMTIELQTTMVGDECRAFTADKCTITTTVPNAMHFCMPYCIVVKTPVLHSIILDA